MKLLLLIILSTLSFATTKYRTPSFVVENNTLYCHNSCTKDITRHIPGDILSGDYVQTNCSYNESTIKTLQEKRLNSKNSKDESTTVITSYIVLMFIIVIMIVIFGASSL